MNAVASLVIVYVLRIKMPLCHRYGHRSHLLLVLKLVGPRRHNRDMCITPSVGATVQNCMFDVRMQMVADVSGVTWCSATSNT